MLPVIEGMGDLKLYSIIVRQRKPAGAQAQCEGPSGPSSDIHRVWDQRTWLSLEPLQFKWQESQE